METKYKQMLERKYKQTFDDMTVSFTKTTIGDRNVTLCVLETKSKHFYSGVAVVHPKEYPLQKTGWKISLKRACMALTNHEKTGQFLYKILWSQIRKSVWEEQRKKEMEEEDEQTTD